MDYKDVDNIFDHIYGEKSNYFKNLENVRLEKQELKEKICNEEDNLISRIQDNFDDFLYKNFGYIKETITKSIPILEKRCNCSFNNIKPVTDYNIDTDFNVLNQYLNERIEEYNKITTRLNKINFGLNYKEKRIEQTRPDCFDVISKEETTHYDISSEYASYSEKELLELIDHNDANNLLGIIKDIEYCINLITEKIRKDFDIDCFKNIINQNKNEMLKSIDSGISSNDENQLLTNLKNDSEKLLKVFFDQLKTFEQGINQYEGTLTLGSMIYNIKKYKEIKDILDEISVFTEKTQNSKLEIPLLIDLKKKGSIWIDLMNDEYTDQLKDFINHVIVSLITSNPIHNIRLYLFDFNEKIGFAPYMSLKKINDDILPAGIIRDKDQLDEKLNSIRNVKYESEDKLGMEGISNVFEYNNKFSSSPIKLNIAVIADFPFGFDKDKLLKLKNIILNGNNNGVFTIIINNDYIKEEDILFNDEEIERIIDEIKNHSYYFAYAPTYIAIDDDERYDVEVSKMCKLSDISNI